MNKKTPTFFFAVLFVLSFAGAYADAAKSPAPSSPESVVQGYLRALKSGQYLAVAEFMHPEALAKFRTMILPLVEESAGGDPTESLLPLFRGVSDIAALKKLSHAEFFAAFFGGLTDANPGIKEALSSGSLTLTPIGSVPEGDIIHVVCRTSAAVEGISVSKMEVVSLRRSTDSWRVLLSGEMEGIVQALRSAQSGKT
jgi:hypothetical protein